MSDHAVAHAADAGHEHEEHHSHGQLYFMVFWVLCGFTLMSIGADYLQMANKNILRAIILAVATSKALCVMLYFMHLKFDNKLFTYLFYSGLLLAIAVYCGFLATFKFFLAPNEFLLIFSLTHFILTSRYLIWGE